MRSTTSLSVFQGCSSNGRTAVSKAARCGFESYRPCQFTTKRCIVSEYKPLVELPWFTLSKRPVADICKEVADVMVRWHGFASAKNHVGPNGLTERLIHIGTDAQKIGKHTDFVTAVAVLNPGRGAAAFTCKQRAKFVESLQYKLFTEVSFSLEIARVLCDYGISADTIEVHVDANTNMKWESATFSQRLAGMVVANGYKPVLKPDAWAASHLADHAVKLKNEPRKLRRAVRKGK